MSALSGRPLRLLPLALLAACAVQEGPEDLPLSGVLITLDTTNAPALDVYGRDLGLTPNLSSLAEEGIVYDHAHTVAPITLPAHTSMLTGLYPLRHGVRENGIMRLSTEADTLAERAAEAGFETAAFVAASVLFDHYGLDQGFETYDQPASVTGGGTRITERRSSQVTDAALRWLEGRDRGRPFFLWVHYFDPHMPYTPPQRFLDRAGGNPYRAEVAAMDEDIGRLVEGLRASVGLDRVTIAVVADHGEAFQSHGELTHSVYCYDATVRVPFLLRFADGRAAGTRSDEVVSVVDVFPTFLEELGLGAPGGVDGLSLASGAVPDDRGVYVESYSGFLSYGWSPLAGWIDRRGKYLHSSEPEYYDLGRDPAEKRNLLAEGRIDPAPYLEALRALEARPRLAAGGSVELTPQQLAELNALGYAAAASGGDATDLPDPLDPSDLPSPASQAEVYAKSNMATGLLAAGRSEEGLRLLREVVAENPNDLNALESLGAELVRREQFAEALGPLEQVVARTPDRHLTRVSLGIAHGQLGNYEQSLLHFRRAAELQPAGAATSSALEFVEGELARQQGGQGR